MQFNFKIPSHVTNSSKQREPEPILHTKLTLNVRALDWNLTKRKQIYSSF